MTSIRNIALLLAPALAGAALLTATPALAASESEGRAVAQCRAEALRHFPQHSIRSQRVASITGNSRRTRIAMFVTTDRRYSFECTAGADGRVVSATWNPPVDTRLAGGEAGQAQPR
ncbi:MAG TPA: hypothetical protein VMS43_00865 [Allosphingosinicella sp.]|nr:hypothetical protein [Allosphingosinicella sp.]